MYVTTSYRLELVDNDSGIRGVRIKTPCSDKSLLTTYVYGQAITFKDLVAELDVETWSSVVLSPDIFAPENLNSHESDTEAGLYQISCDIDHWVRMKARGAVVWLENT